MIFIELMPTSDIARSQLKGPVYVGPGFSGNFMKEQTKKLSNIVTIEGHIDVSMQIHSKSNAPASTISVNEAVDLLRELDRYLKYI